jgi:hypothetical protein
MYKFSTDFTNFTDSGYELFKLQFEILINSSEPLKKRITRLLCSSLTAGDRQKRVAHPSAILNSGRRKASPYNHGTPFLISNF